MAKIIHLRVILNKKEDSIYQPIENMYKFAVSNNKEIF